MAAQHLPRYLGGLAVDKRRAGSNEKKTNERSNMLCESFSLTACDLLSNCFVKKILSDACAYLGLA